MSETACIIFCFAFSLVLLAIPQNKFFLHFHLLFNDVFTASHVVSLYTVLTSKITAVSYTHLDVYKRQVYIRRNKFIMYNGSGRMTIFSQVTAVNLYSLR